jgi:hypothetical protein
MYCVPIKLQCNFQAELSIIYGTGCGRNNSHISKEDGKTMVRGITKNFLFPKCNVDIKKFFLR